MKRDLDLIRDLLLIIESADSPNPVNPYNINASMPRVQHHLHLLVEAGFVRGVGETADGSISVRLTWQGYEFLELIRDDTMWRRVKRYVLTSTSGTNVEILKSTLTDQFLTSMVASSRRRLDYSGDQTKAKLALHNNAEPQPAKQPTRHRTHIPVAQPVVVERTEPKAAPRTAPAPIPSLFADVDTHFQFHVYNDAAYRGNHVDTLPLYLL